MNEIILGFQILAIYAAVMLLSVGIPFALTYSWFNFENKILTIVGCSVYLFILAYIVGLSAGRSQC